MFYLILLLSLSCCTTTAAAEAFYMNSFLQDQLKKYPEVFQNYQMYSNFMYKGVDKNSLKVQSAAA